MKDATTHLMTCSWPANIRLWIGCLCQAVQGSQDLHMKCWQEDNAKFKIVVCQHQLSPSAGLTQI